MLSHAEILALVRGRKYGNAATRRVGGSRKRTGSARPRARTEPVRPATPTYRMPGVRGSSGALSDLILPVRTHARAYQSISAPRSFVKMAHFRRAARHRSTVQHLAVLQRVPGSTVLSPQVVHDGSRAPTAKGLVQAEFQAPPWDISTAACVFVTALPLGFIVNCAREP